MQENLIINTMKRFIIYLAVICLSGLLFNSCYYDTEEELYKFSNPACDSINVTYALTIAPIIQTSCASCHSGASPSGNLSLQNYGEVVTGVNSRNLYARITSTASPMPPAGLMEDCKIKQIKKWIDAGVPNN